MGRAPGGGSGHLYCRWYRRTSRSCIAVRQSQHSWPKVFALSISHHKQSDSVIMYISMVCWVVRSQVSTERSWFKVSRFCCTSMKYSCDRLRSVLKVDPTRGLVLIVVNVDASTMHGRVSFNVLQRCHGRGHRTWRSCSKAAMRRQPGGGCYQQRTREQAGALQTSSVGLRATCICELQHKCQLLGEFSIENAEIVENCP